MLEKINTFLGSAGGFFLHKLLPALLLFVVGLFAIKILLKILTKALSKSKLEKPALSLILAVLRVMLYLLLALAAVSYLGIDVTGVVALASVLTLAISLSVQDALTNLIGGFSLLYTKPFTIGDYAEIGGQNGTVTQIGLTYTKLLTADGKTVSIPNSAVVSAQIVNYTVYGKRRVDIPVAVSYDCQPEVVISALLEAAQMPTALQDPAPYAAVSSYGDSAVNYILQIWVETPDYWPTLHTVNRNLPEIFQKAGIEMTYPHLNIHLDK